VGDHESLATGWWSDIGFVVGSRTLPNRELKGADGRHTTQCRPG
jgi:hypothetical protein